MSITLHYFDMYGRAEVIRMILHTQGLEFTDHRFAHDQFESFSALNIAEFGSVPCLEIDGKALVESRAIERYILERSGTTTATPLEGYSNDSTISFLDDLRNIFGKLLIVDKNPEATAEWMTNELPSYLRLLDARVNDHYLFVNDKPQHADWAVFEFLEDAFLRERYAATQKPLLYASAPKLATFAEKFKENHPRLVEYLAGRPDCQY